MNEKIKILVVEDESIVSESNKIVLEILGYDVHGFIASCKKVIKEAKKINPHLILLDINISEKDGIEVCNLLKKNELTSEIPIIFMTAHSDGSNKVKRFELDTLEKINKPIKTEELLTRVRTNLTLFFLQQEMKNVNKLLEEKVFKRTLELEESNFELGIAKEKAEEMNRVKSNFYSNMSHELRTPLVGILGFSEIIKEECENEELKEFGSMIYSSAFRLQRTLNIILDFSKVEKSNFNLDIEEIDINTLVQNEFNLFKIEAEKKQLDFRLIFKSDPISINSDRRILGTIINHIIDNAVKYTDNGFVEVIVSIREEEGIEKLIIEVKDSGKGIKTDKLNVIWEEFRQASEGFTRKYEGVGLGLSIVKKFIGYLNGSVDVKSKFGEGSSFCFKIPTLLNLNENIAKRITVADNKKKKTIDKENVILVVEDEKMNAIAIKKFLNKTYSTEVASSPLDVFEMCKLNNYSLVLMDINLKSDIDGIELMRELKRKSQTFKDTPFIAQTAYTMDKDKKRIMDSGFNDYIAKPYTRNALLEIVNKNLSLEDEQNYIELKF